MPKRLTMPLSRCTLAFSLRTLLVLVGMLCAWLAWERHGAVKRRAARQFLESRGASSRELDDGAWDSFDPPAPRRDSLSWIRRALGDEPIVEIGLPSEIGLPTTRSPGVERALDWFSEAAKGIQLSLQLHMGQDAEPAPQRPLHPPPLPYSTPLPRRTKVSAPANPMP